MKYPKGEIVWVSHFDKDGKLRYIVTSKPSRDYYFLYAVENEEFKKLGKGVNPNDLERKFKVHENLG